MKLSSPPASALPHLPLSLILPFRPTASASAAHPPSPTPLPDYLADQKGLPRDQVTSWTPYPGGAPANVAAALATLGAHVAFVSALGKDALGDAMAALLAAKGVDVSPVQRVDAPTRDVYVVFDGAGERQFVGFGSPDPAAFADCALDAARLPMATLLADPGVTLVTGTLGLAYPATAAAMTAAVDAVRGGGGTVVVDVNWRPVFFADPGAAPRVVAPYVARADIVKLADEEAAWLYGVPADAALADPGAVLAALPPSTAGVLVTAGGAGCSYAFRPAPGVGGGGGTPLLTGRLPAAAVEVVDTTGAGDAFLAGFLYAMGALGGLAGLRAGCGDGGALRAAVAFGAACGAATTTRPGAIDAQPTLAEAAEMAAAFAAQWKQGA